MELSKKASKTLNRFVDDGYYVILRPSSSCWRWPDDEPGTFWSVTVEFRSASWIHWEAKGDDLDAIFKKLAKIIPCRTELDPGFVPAGSEGCQFGAMTRKSAAPKLEHGKVYVEIRKQESVRPNPGIPEKKGAPLPGEKKSKKKGKKK